MICYSQNDSDSIFAKQVFYQISWWITAVINDFCMSRKIVFLEDRSRLANEINGSEEVCFLSKSIRFIKYLPSIFDQLIHEIWHTLLLLFTFGKEQIWKENMSFLKQPRYFPNKKKSVDWWIGNRKSFARK